MHCIAYDYYSTISIVINIKDVLTKGTLSDFYINNEVIRKRE